MSSKEKCTEEACFEKIRRKLLKLFYQYQYYILLGLFLFFFFPFCSALFRYLLVDSSTKIPSFLTGFNTSVAAKWVFAIICILSFLGSLFLTNKQRVVTKKEYGLKCRKSFLYVALGVIYFFFIRPFFAYDLEVLIHFHGVPIYFFDALLLIPLYQLISVFIINKENSNDAIAQDTEDGFLVESPISQSEDDRYYRDELAKLLVEKIMHTHNEESSFGIGIVGKWGTGKTSFMNLMCKEVEDKAILVNFRPWVYDNKNSLTYAFFMGLSKALKPYNKSLARDIKFYQSLLNAVDTKFTRLCSALLNRNNDFDTQHLRISQAIKKIGKPIIVMIDDLDRLDEQEIVEVLKLIRNTASFPRTFYVAAYDREYINTAIKKINKCDSNKYLEKIFQYELSLPPYNLSVIGEYLREKIKPFLAIQNKEAIRTIDTDIQSSFIKFFYNVLPVDNIRESIRLINMFSLPYKSLTARVDVCDLLKVEVLRFKYPNEYRAFAKNHESYLTKNADGYLCIVDKNNPDLNSFDRKTKFDIHDNNCFSSEFISLIKNLFSEEYKPYSIRLPLSCKRYFSYYYEAPISNEFDNKWSSDLETFKLYIKNLSSLYNQFLQDTLQNLIYCNLYLSFSSLSEDETCKRMIHFLFLYYDKVTKSYERAQIQSYLVDVIMNYKNVCNVTYKSSLISAFEEYYYSDLSYITLASTPLDWISSFKFNIYDFLDEKQVSQIQRFNFNKCIGNEKGFSIVMQLVFYSAKSRRNQEVCEAFWVYIKEHISEGIIEYLLLFQIQKLTPGYYLKQLIPFIWESWDAFISFIDENIPSKKQSQGIREFKSFYKKWLSEEPNKYISFDFKYLKPFDNSIDKVYYVLPFNESGFFDDFSF